MCTRIITFLDKVRKAGSKAPVDDVFTTLADYGIGIACGRAKVSNGDNVGGDINYCLCCDLKVPFKGRLFHEISSVVLDAISQNRLDSVNHLKYSIEPKPHHVCVDLRPTHLPTRGDTCRCMLPSQDSAEERTQRTPPTGRAFAQTALFHPLSRETVVSATPR